MALILGEKIMKKILMLGAALAMVAGTASAQSYAAGPYGNDGQANWALSGEVGEFCKLGGTATPRPVTGAVVTPGSNGEAGSSAQNGDGTIEFAIQSPNNTLAKATGGVSFANSQCNTRFNVTATSRGGGLKNTAFGTAFDDEFTDTVLYDVYVNFDGDAGYVENLTGTSTLISNNQPTAGQFAINIDVDADNNVLLLEGTYTDFLEVRMTPVM